MFGGGRSRPDSSSSSGEVSRDGRRQQGIFTSPNHPQVYSTNINCILYTFSAGPHQIVEITFNDFNLQIPATSKSECVRLLCCGYYKGRGRTLSDQSFYIKQDNVSTVYRKRAEFKQLNINTSRFSVPFLYIVTTPRQ